MACDPSGWHIGALTAAVDGNGQVEILDLLNLIEFLAPNPGGIEVNGPNRTAPRIYPDVTGDSNTTLLDVLTVVQALSALSG